MRVTDDLPSAPGRSLVPVAQHGPATATAGPHHSRPSAPFLAQLVAVAQGAPQMRIRRRATAGHVATLYAAAARHDRPSVIERSI